MILRLSGFFLLELFLEWKLILKSVTHSGYVPAHAWEACRDEDHRLSRSNVHSDKLENILKITVKILHHVPEPHITNDTWRLSCRCV